MEISQRRPLNAPTVSRWCEDAAMDSFANKIAVVTGAGDGMGRSLAMQLAEAGCHIALCDVLADKLASTVDQVSATFPEVRVTGHSCDVSDEDQWQQLRDGVLSEHSTDHIHLLFNNAGIAGSGSMVVDDRDQWERTFNVCWNGVYLGVRTFLPLLMAAPEARIINTSSVNGFWASLGPDTSHTAYSAAKFAVKGFSEALITDLAINAPHVDVSVVMPGHIGTGIAENSVVVHGGETDPSITEMAATFRNSAPMTADEAATIILDGVRARRWRILVGDDAQVLDMAVRAHPEEAYDADFNERLGGHFARLLDEET